jgi:outer membrane protein OmpA-like peptidoglycan-associated protein
MKDKFDIVSGDFEGNFYTHQKAVLSASESTIDKKHDIHLYRGELRNVKNENEYNPKQLRNRESYLLHNVTNVQFHLEKDATGNNNRIYNFEQILLRDAVIKESWELNGKTYGIIRGKLLGKLKDEVKPPDPTNPQEPPKPPPIIPDPIKPRPEPLNPNPTGGGNGTNDPNKFWNNWGRPTTPTNPSFPNGNSGCLNIGNGCLPAVSGCLSNIWRMLLALLLLLFIIWFLKGCWNKKEESQNCCSERDSLAIENKKLQNEIDSLNNSIKENENDRIRDSVQNKISELASRIFFKKTKTEIREYSSDEIDKIISILNQYPNSKIEVHGYYDVTLLKSLGNTDDLDQRRANTVRDLIIEKGISSDRVVAIGKGRSTLDESESVTGYDEEGNSYNRNMRVDIVLTNF